MNHVYYGATQFSGTVSNLCQPERNLVMSDANRQTRSKDPCRANGIRASQGNFRIAVRFFDDHDAEHFSITSTAPPMPQIKK